MAAEDWIMLGISSVITVGGGLTAWAFNMLLNAIKDQREDHDIAVKESRDTYQAIEKSLAQHKLHAAETFATKADVQSGFDKVMLKLDSISVKFDTFNEKLEKKADK